MRVVVTGAAGMIGSNLVHALNAHGVDEIIAVDDLTDGSKFRHLLGARVSDYFDRSEFYHRFARGELGRIEVVFHQGALSDTMEHNGRSMLENNYRCSKDLLDACQSQGTRLLYASSAAVYGGESRYSASSPSTSDPSTCTASPSCCSTMWCAAHCPACVRKWRDCGISTSTARASSTRAAWPRWRSISSMQFREAGKVRLFGDYGGYGAGKQARDFIHVDDVIAVNLWFLEHPESNGVFNVGTGRAQPFNDVAHAVINACRALAWRAGADSRAAALERPDRIRAVSAGAGGQVSVSHPRGPRGAARGGLPTRFARRRRGGGSLRGVARAAG